MTSNNNINSTSLRRCVCRYFLNKVRYILWLMTLREACDQQWLEQQWLELEIRLKPQEMVIFCALHEKITHK